MSTRSGEQSVIVDTRRSPHARLRAVPLAAVRFEDAFWAPRLESVRRVTLPSQYTRCEETGRIDNFRRAAGTMHGDFQGRYYNDSDVYKWLEAASYALATAGTFGPVARGLVPRRGEGAGDKPPRYNGEHEAGAETQVLRRTVDGLVEEIAAAQAPDGYLNTYFTFAREAERFTNLVQMHELYCAGHLIQAAVAHHRATGSHRLLGVATRLADHICTVFGPQARAGTDGHEEIELALVELYRDTGDRTYLDRAGFFLDQRGQRPPVLNGSEYLQDHLPVREQRDVAGHAVRATYLACGMADVYLETGDAMLLPALDALWESAFERKAYITGGLGAHYAGEAFGADYVLPNERAYAETCAAIGGLMWNWRSLLRTGEARYADWMETALYNGVLSGLSLAGDTYFYQNPLADRGTHRRTPWFTTACCPPNIARLLLALPGYAASVSVRALWLHLYAAGQVAAAVPGSGSLAVRVETDYPWEGLVRLVVEQAPDAPVTLRLRVPAWCVRPTLTVNGRSAPAEVVPGSYAALEGRWQAGDEVALDLPMPVRRVRAHPRVLADHGRVALARGPLVYCIEGADHPGIDVWDLELPATAQVAPRRAPDLLGGVTVLEGEAAVVPAPPDAPLYAQEQSEAREDTALPARLTAIPYYAWANRAPGPMQVWVREGPHP